MLEFHWFSWFCGCTVFIKFWENFDHNFSKYLFYLLISPPFGAPITCIFDCLMLFHSSLMLFLCGVFFGGGVVLSFPEFHFSFYCYVFKFFFFSFSMSNLPLIPSCEFFLSYIVFFISRCSILAFYKSPIPLLEFWTYGSVVITILCLCPLIPTSMSVLGKFQLIDFFYYHMSYISFLICMSGNFRLDAWFSEFYFVGCYFFFHRHKYSWALFWNLVK